MNRLLRDLSRNPENPGTRKWLDGRLFQGKRCVQRAGKLPKKDDPNVVTSPPSTLDHLSLRACHPALPPSPCAKFDTLSGWRVCYIREILG